MRCYCCIIWPIRERKRKHFYAGLTFPDLFIPQRIKCGCPGHFSASFFADASAEFRKWAIWLHVHPSVWGTQAPTMRIFMQFDIRRFFENLSRKCKFSYNMTRIKGTLQAEQYAVMVKFRLTLGNMHPIYRTDVQLLHRVHFFIYLVNKYI